MHQNSLPKVVDRRKAVEAQTVIRHDLLENGYTPLPAREKVVSLRGWPVMQPTEADIAEWGHTLDYRTTALRLDGDLVAIDVDVNHPFADEIVDLFDEMVDPDQQTLMREGKGHKVMFLARVDEPFGVMRSRAMLEPDAPDDSDAHFVEVFSSGKPRYFTCFGAHTEGKLTAEGQEILIEYRWGDDDPTTVPLEDLPVLRRADLLAFTLRVGEIMEDAGWRPVPRSPEGEVESDFVKYLTPDMTFEIQHGPTVPLEELADHEGKRCSATWLDGGHNRSRCIISVDDEGMPMVWDTATFAHYVPLDWQSRSERSAEANENVMRELGAALLTVRKTDPHIEEKAREQSEKAAMAQARRDLRPSDRYDWALQHIHDSYAYFPAGSGAEQVVPLDGSATRALGPFTLEWAPFEIEGEIGPRGGKPPILNPVKVWLKSGDRLTVEGYRFLPGVTDPVIVHGQRVWVNLWRGPEFGDSEPHSLDLFLKLLDHLFPVEEEREWFINWLAYKLQNPGERGQAAVMVSVRGRAGRNTLFKILQGVFGPTCKNVRAGDLLGTLGQAEFNEWLESTTVGFCTEFRMVGNGSYMDKHAAYERLKELVDPNASEMSVNEKFKARRSIISPMALIIATNNEDALPLPVTDGRFTVLTNAETDMMRRPWAEKLVALEVAGKYDLGFCRAIHDWLMSLPANARDFKNVLPTEAREEMIISNEGRIEEYLRIVLGQYSLKRIVLRSETDIVADIEAMCEQKGQTRLRDVAKTEVHRLLRRGFDGWLVSRRNIVHVDGKEFGNMVFNMDVDFDTTMGRHEFAAKTGKALT